VPLAALYDFLSGINFAELISDKIEELLIVLLLGYFISLLFYFVWSLSS